MSAQDQPSATETVAQAIETKSLSRVFNAYVSETVRYIPEMAGHFAILNVTAAQVHMDIDPQKAGFKNQEALMDYMSQLQTTYAPHATSVAHFDGGLGDDGTRRNLAVLVYNGPLHMQMFADTIRDPLKNIVGIMDHELGHILVEGAYYYTNRHSPTEILYAEAAADTYAGIRHISRFGGTGDDIRQLSWQRAKHMIEYGDDAHFTALSLDRLAELVDKHDISAVSPYQAVDLSARIASETAPHSSAIANASRFLPQVKQNIVQTRGYEEALKPLADKVLKGDMDYMASKIADKYLSHFLMEEVQYNGKPVLLDGPYWDKVRIALCNNQTAQDSLGVLHGLPVKQKPPSI